jgi:hypothetical protein
MDFMRAVIEVDNINVHSGDRICRSADVHLNLLFQINTAGTVTEFGVLWHTTRTDCVYRPSLGSMMPLYQSISSDLNLHKHNI